MYGLVLEGGGAKGSYQAGAYKAFKESGIEIAAVCGTSIGALNGAMIVQGQFETCLDLWNDIRYSDIIRANDDEVERLLHLRADMQSVVVIADKLKGVISNKGLDITPFRSMLTKYVDEELIRQSPMDFGIVTYNLTDRISMEMFKEDIPKGEMKDYLLASAYFPLFRLEKIGGKTYLDGWFHDNLPYHMLLKKGYEKLVIIRTHQMGEGDLVDIMHLDPIIVAPSHELGRTFDLDGERIKLNLKLGYLDARRILDDLKGSRYYLWPRGEDYYFDYLKGLDNKKIESLSNLLNIDASPSLGLLYSALVPRLGNMLGLGKSYDYEMFIVALMEDLLFSAGIENLRVYDFEELLGILRKSDLSFHRGEEGVKEVIINRFGRMVPFNREDILVRAAKIIFLD